MNREFQRETDLQTTRRDLFRTAGGAAAVGALFSGSATVAGQGSADSTGNDESSFEPAWTYPTLPAIESKPAVTDGTLYVGLARGVAALDATDGTIQWHFEVDEVVEAQPQVVDGTVYIATRGAYIGYDQKPSGTGNVYALDADDGSKEWVFEAGTQFELPPAVGDNAVAVLDTDGVLQSIDATDGSPNWSESILMDEPTPPLVADGQIFLQLEYEILAFDATNGTETWRRQQDGYVNSTPVVDDRALYTVADETIRALDTADGSERWSVTFDDYPLSMTLIGETLYARIDGAAFHTVSTETGTEQKLTSFEEEAVRDYRIVDGTIYASQEEGFLAVDAEADEIHWRSETDRVWLAGFGEEFVFRLGAWEMTALNTADGSVAWESSRETGHLRTITNGHIYLDSWDSYTAIDGSDRDVVWTHTTGDKQYGKDFSPSDDWRPLFTDERLYSNSSNAGALSARSLSDGTELWSVETDGQVLHILEYDDTVYTTDESGILQAVSATDGTERWRVTLESPKVTDLLVRDNTLYVTADDSIFALQTADGAVDWHYETETNEPLQPAVGDETIYVGGGTRYEDETGVISAIDLADGTEQWRAEKAAFQRPEQVVEDTLVLTAGLDEIIGVDTADGSEKWRRGGEDTLWWGLTVTEDAIYATDNDGVFHALNVEDGTTQWRFETNNNHGGVEPTITDGTVYIGGSDNYVYALDTADGEQQWSFDVGYPLSASPLVDGGTVYVSTWDRRVFALSQSSGFPGQGVSIDGVSSATDNWMVLLSGAGIGSLVTLLGIGGAIAYLKNRRTE
jgi:outer membrane protein assembly factor BamB